MDFSPFLDWVNVPNPSSPPAGARKIGASDLLRYENALSQAAQELELLNGAGQRGYTVSQTAGRTVSVWDYLNNREQLIYGDTGKRYLTHEGVTGGIISIRRVGMVVSFIATALKLAGSGNVNLTGIIPPGLRPDGYLNVDSNPYWSSEVSRRVRCTGPDLQFQSVQVGDVINLSATWVTSDPWPTTLPGAVSSFTN